MGEGERAQHTMEIILEAGNANFTTETRSKLLLRINDESFIHLNDTTRRMDTLQTKAPANESSKAPAQVFKVLDETWSHMN